MSWGGLRTFSIGFAGSMENVINISRNLRGQFQAQRDLTPALDEAVGILMRRIKDRYMAKVDVNGVPWVQSAAALRGQARRGGDGAKQVGQGTLYVSGRLYESIKEGPALGKTTRTIIADAQSPNGAMYGYILQHRNNWQFLDSGGDDEVLILNMMKRRFAEKGLDDHG